MSQQIILTFEQADLLSQLEALDDSGIDLLDFGVIGFDANDVICRYNAYESRAASFVPEKALGRPLFTVVAQCMNNYLVAQRFDDARNENKPLDATINYVLTWSMRPTNVKLRMLSSPEYSTRYVLLHHLS